MKKIFNNLLSLLIALLLLNCKEPATTKEDQSKGDTAQKIELVVDGTKRTGDAAPLISCAYTSSHLVLGYLSDKDDIQFSVSAYMQELKPGSYQVYDCKSASECNEQMPDNNQIAQFGPYPKDPMPALSLFRTAYNAPKLGLKPLTFVVTSVTDEQQAGNPLKVKRIEGKFDGSLAYVIQVQGGYDWQVLGKTNQVNGNFSVLCNIR